MNLRQGLLAGLAVGACIVGGALECRRPELSVQQQRGRQLYGNMCAVCHGPDAEGYAADRAPAIGHPAFIGSAPDAMLMDVISHGRTGTTMSAWSLERGGPLPPEDVAAIIAYLRTLSDAPPAALDESPLRGSSTKAVAVYRRQCEKCHGYRGKDGPNVSIGNPELLEKVSNGFLRLAIREGREGTPMPAFGESLGDETIDDLVALLRTYEKPPAPQRPQVPERPPPIPLGPVPLNPKGPAPAGFVAYPKTTKCDVVHAQLKRGAKMAILDARAPTAYAHEHIAGAVSVPFYDPTPYFDKLPKDAWLVAYCACPAAESRTLAGKLQEAGFQKVTVLEEGLGYWRQKQYGTTKGREP